MIPQFTRVECQLGGQPLILETGLVARQAHGSVMATYGQTQVLAAVCYGPAREGIDFFPLTVDYREKTDAAGKIPGGFFKREGRPTTKEIITMRLIDRSIRPLFPDGYKDEVQVQSQVFGYDGEAAADVLAMIASFAALHISPIPFRGALSAVRIGHLDGKLTVMPTDMARRGESKLDLIVSGHQDAIVMVEAGARELPEAVVIDALELAHQEIRGLCAALEELRQKAGKPKLTFAAPTRNDALAAEIEKLRPAIRTALFTSGKQARYQAIAEIKEKCVAAATVGATDEAAAKARAKEAKALYEEVAGAVERETILNEKKRADGRVPDQIRDIFIVPNFIVRQHGSVLFTRGETQAIVSCTLGTPDDEQIIDGIEEEYKKRFYLHYNFPPYSVGETRPIRGPGRREIGHGMLAERALQGVLPENEKFPYTIRLVSDITESNGSSSMASVCGGTMAMMLAGVPIAQPVAGIAMGLVSEGDRFVVLSDIAGSEDHNGDMDFKVAGSGLGITALQMDIKVEGVTRALLEAALKQARTGRIHILKTMLSVVDRPSAEISRWAPRYEVVRIPSDKIGALIGPGGKTIKAMQEQFEVRISVVGDDGQIQIYGNDPEKVKAAGDAITAMCETPKIGARYSGTVKGIKDFGAFVEIMPGVEGMVHVSELAEGFVERVSDVVAIGQKLEVVVINVDDRGKIKLSHKKTLAARE